VDINHYLIDQTGLDWQTMLSGWAEILPPTFTIWLVNRFGDVFTIVDDGPVYLLDIGAGTFKRVAEGREEFADLADTPNNSNDWLMIPLVDLCVAAGIRLAPRQCYGFKTPPLLGGECAVHNIAPVDLAENYAFLADLFAQTKDLRDGTPVRLVIKPRPTTLD
jgi:hypothetical protein